MKPHFRPLRDRVLLKRVEVEEKTPADYGVDVSPRLKVMKTSEQPGRKAGVKVKSVAELVSKLHDEAGVI